MKVINKKAGYNYDLLEKIEAGVILTGSEVKSVKNGKINLDQAFVRIDPQLEVWLVNTHIHPYEFSNNTGYDPTHSRKLLLHKKEVLSLSKKMEAKNLTLVPTACYTKKGKIKVELALAKGKREWEKREKIRKKDLDREMERELKNR